MPDGKKNGEARKEFRASSAISVILKLVKEGKRNWSQSGPIPSFIILLKVSSLHSGWERDHWPYLPIQIWPSPEPKRNAAVTKAPPPPTSPRKLQQKTCTASHVQHIDEWHNNEWKRFLRPPQFALWVKSSVKNIISAQTVLWPSHRSTSWWSDRTRSRVLSLGSGVWSSPPPPAPSDSWVGSGSPCMWPRLPRPEHTPPRCWKRNQAALWRIFAFWNILGESEATTFLSTETIAWVWKALLTLRYEQRCPLRHWRAGWSRDLVTERSSYTRPWTLDLSERALFCKQGQKSVEVLTERKTTTSAQHAARGAPLPPSTNQPKGLTLSRCACVWLVTDSADLWAAAALFHPPKLGFSPSGRGRRGRETR